MSTLCTPILCLAALEVSRQAGEALFVTITVFVGLCFLVGYLRFEHLLWMAEQGKPASLSAEDLLYLQLVRRSSHKLDSFFVLLAVSHTSPENGDPSARLAWVEKVIRDSLRKSDSLVRLDKDCIGVVIDAPKQAVEPIGSRLRSNLQAGCPGSPNEPMLETSFRMVSYPENGKDAESFLDACRQKMDPETDESEPRIEGNKPGSEGSDTRSVKSSFR